MSKFVPEDLLGGDVYEEDEGPLLHQIYKVPASPKDLSVCSIEYILKDRNKPVICIFARDSTGVDYVIPVDKFRPYCYVTKHDARKVEEWKDLPPVMIDYTNSLPSYAGLDLAKVYTIKPSHVSSVKSVPLDPKKPRKKIKTWEADILYPLRYMIDRGVKTGIHWNIDGTVIPTDMPSNFRKLYVDIEVLASKSPDVINVPDEVIVIGMYDNISDIYTIMATKPIEDLKLEDYLTKEGNITYIYCKNERLLLDKFITYVQATRPDVFLSFTNFDWLYLFNRMKKLHMKYRRMSRVEVIQFFGSGTGEGGAKIKVHGIQFMDLQRMYYQVFLRGSKWETLHGIAQRELGEEKLYREESVYKNWHEAHSRVLVRNLRDVEIIKRLDEELSLLDYFDAIRRTIGSNLNDTLYKSRVADIMFLRFCNGKFALPSKTIKKKIEYQGAIVFPVEPGIYRNVVIFDWSSMYPSIIMAFNMSFETYCQSNYGEDFNYNIDDLYFFRKKEDGKGWTVQLLETLIPLRTPYKKRSNDKSLSKEERLYNKSVSDGIKSVINSIYGVFGHAGSEKERIKAYRIYLPFIAAATTYVGRKLQEDGLKPICADIGYDILYADTDSIFLILKTDDHEKEIKWLEETISGRMNQFIRDRWGVDPNYLELSFDDQYPTMVMFSKKRYIGKTLDDRIVTKGLEIVRKDTADITALAQNSVANAVFEDKSKEEIIEVIKDIIAKFRELPLEDIAIAKNLTKQPFEYGVLSGHLKAFLWSSLELELDLQIGKRFWTTYIKHKEIPEKYPPLLNWWDKKYDSIKRKINVVAWDDMNDLPEDIRAIVDYDIMLEKTVRDKIKDFLSLLDISWYEDILEVEDPKKKKERLRREKKEAKAKAKAEKAKAKANKAKAKKKKKK